MFTTKQVRLEGLVPLLVHNERLSDPLNKHSVALKRLSKIRTKTEEDHHAVARCEWEGGMYYDQDVGPYVPDRCVSAVIRDGAKKVKLGKATLSSVFVVDDLIPIQYSGPRELDAMWNDGSFVDRRSVVVSRARIMRTRPIFREWALDFAVQIDESVINPDQVRDALIEAGMHTGLCEYRPRFGRFGVVSWK